MRRTTEFLQIFFVFLWLFSATACVTIKVGNSDLKKAENLALREPSKPFDEIKTTNADRAWQNPNTGSTISYVSSCGESVDPSLENLRASLLQGVSELQIQKQGLTPFNGREALDSFVTGSVDGVPVKMRILVFKKNSCNYHLSFVTLKPHFDSDSPRFEEFMKGFQAP